MKRVFVLKELSDGQYDVLQKVSMLDKKDQFHIFSGVYLANAGKRR
jgi:hypothetical protein